MLGCLLACLLCRAGKKVEIATAFRQSSVLARVCLAASEQSAKAFDYGGREGGREVALRARSRQRRTATGSWSVTGTEVLWSRVSAEFGAPRFASNNAAVRVIYNSEPCTRATAAAALFLPAFDRQRVISEAKSHTSLPTAAAAANAASCVRPACLPIRPRSARTRAARFSVEN